VATRVRAVWKVRVKLRRFVCSGVVEGMEK
jgi:hypothetical protein